MQDDLRPGLGHQRLHRHPIAQVQPLALRPAPRIMAEVGVDNLVTGQGLRYQVLPQVTTPAGNEQPAHASSLAIPAGSGGIFPPVVDM